MDLFPDQSVWREHQHWKSIYTKPISVDNDTQQFANYGCEKQKINFMETDSNEIINSICDKLAEEIIDQIFTEHKPESRHIQTSNFNRRPYFARITQKTPLQGNVSRRNMKSNQHLLLDNKALNSTTTVIHRRSQSTT